MQSARPEEDKSFRIEKIIRISAQVTLFILGSGAGFLYVGPGKTCATMETCGKYLSDVITPEGGFIVFSLGGLDFSAINAYFSAKSVEDLIAYLKRQSTTRAQVAKGIAISVFAVSQDIGLMLTSMSTSTAAWQWLLTTAGGLPGALSGSVSLAENEMPRLVSYLKHRAHAFRYAIKSCFSPLTEEELRYQQRIQYYSRMQTSLVTQLNASLETLISRADSAAYPGAGTNPLHYLMQNYKTRPTPTTWLDSAVTGLSVFTSTYMTGIITATFFANTLSVIADYIPSLPLELVIGIFLSISSVHNNWDVIGHGAANLSDSLIHLVRGHGLNSLAAKLRPKTTAFATIACLALSTLSYAVMDVVYESTFDRKDYDARIYETGRFSALASMDFYHLVGLFHFYKLLLSTFTRDQREQFLFEVERQVHRMNRMSGDEFIENVESDKDGFATSLGLLPERLIDEEAPESETEKLLYLDETDPLLAPKQEPQTSSWFSSCFGLFGRKTEKSSYEAHATPRAIL